MFELTSIGQEMLTIFLISALGYLVGRIKIKGIGFGTSGIFLVALIFGHFGAEISPGIQNLGLLLFITSVAMSAGPTFINQLRSNGISYCALCITVAIIGSLTCALIVKFGGIAPSLAVGIMSGAFTTSPGLASAQEAAKNAKELSWITAGYGIIYPIGVISKVLLIQLIPKLLHSDMEVERLKIQVPKKATESKKTLINIDRWGLCSFSLVIILGILLGSIHIPLPGNLTFSLGITGGPLVLGILVGHIGHIGPINLRPSENVYGPLKEIGLIMFYCGAGVVGGKSIMEILQAYGPSLVIYGTLLAVIPMTIGYFVATKVLHLSLLNGLGSLSASMTSTPALAMLVDLAGTDDVAAAYAATYPIALITLVVTMQILVHIL